MKYLRPFMKSASEVMSEQYSIASYKTQHNFGLKRLK